MKAGGINMSKTKQAKKKNLPKKLSIDNKAVKKYSKIA